MGFFKDFKAFLFKGDIINLATAVIVGGAFGKIVSSFTNDVLMPPIGMLLGGVNFTELKLEIKEATTNAAGEVIPAVTINYGSFTQTILDFVIIGFCIFMVLKAYEKTQKKKEEAPAKPKGPTQEELLTQIRDLLKDKK
ncbi:large-conductance mechanosensitive channel protein MscL [Leptobacterium sp. I13]|uniref:large-conductance mechanosensitive channel protein MscL n=1 Tax=Leptobacterium meishanense TaxID=3128904 RepID=UPI0030EC5198